MKKMISYVLIGVGFAFAVHAASVPSPKNSFLKTCGGPLVQAHRGSCQEYDDNAIGGFKRCLEKGIKGFEIDFKYTKDHHIIVMHDETIDRTTDGHGAPEEMTFAELRQYRLKMSSEPIPDIDEVLEVLGGRDDIFVEFEMKVYPNGFYGNRGTLERFCREVVEKVESKMCPGTYVFTAWSPYTLMTFRNINPDTPLGFIICHAMTPLELDFAKLLNLTSVLPMMNTPPELVKAAHDEGMSVCLWPVKDLETYNEAKAKGSDRITTDYAVLLTRAIEGRPKKVIAMDLDATLCQHRSPIPEKNMQALKELCGKYKCIMSGAGNAPRIYKQMGNFPIDIVGNYGMQIAEAADGNFRIVKAVTNEVDKAFFREKTDYLRQKYGYTEYEGEPLEFHTSGMVTFGLLGTSPSAEHKVAFDPDKKKRRAMYKEVCDIFKDFSVYIGGSTSFDFAGKEYNKYDATLRWAKEHGYTLDDVLFIGDDFADGGGDSHVRIKGMDHIVIYDYRQFADNVRVLLK